MGAPEGQGEGVFHLPSLTSLDKQQGLGLWERAENLEERPGRLPRCPSCESREKLLAQVSEEVKFESQVGP